MHGCNFSTCCAGIVFHSFKSWRSLDQLPSSPEECAGSHTQYLGRSATNKKTIRSDMMGIRDMFDEGVVLHTRIPIHFADAGADYFRHFCRWTIGIFIAVQADETLIFSPSRGFDCAGART